MKKVWGADELSRLFVTGPTDASGKPSHFYSRICRKDVSVMKHRVHGILRHYQGTKLFQRDQRLRLETPGWRVLDFEGNPMREEKVEQQRERILVAPQVVTDREYRFPEDLIVDSSGSVDVSLPVLAKVSALVEALRLGGSYELVYQLCSVHFDCWASVRRRYMVTRWGVGWCLFAILYVVIPAVHCCFAFSQSSSMACNCSFWARSSVGQRRTVIEA